MRVNNKNKKAPTIDVEANRKRRIHLMKIAILSFVIGASVSAIIWILI